MFQLSQTRLRRPLSRTGLLLTAALTSVLTGAPAHADLINNTARVTMSYFYNDNPTLRPKDSPIAPASTSIIRADARAAVEWGTARTSASLTGRVNRPYYTNRSNSDAEQTNWYIDGDASYSTILNTFSVAGGYSQLGVLSDVVGEGTDLPGGGGGSSLNVDDTVTRTSVVPAWTWTMTEKDSLQTIINYNTTRFKLDNTGRADNDGAQISLNYSRIINQRWTLGGTVSYNRFESERDLPFGVPPIGSINTKLSSKSTGASINLSYAWSPRTQFSGRFGRTTTDTKTINTPSDPQIPTLENTFIDAKNSLYALTLDHQGEITRWSIAASRTIVPNNQGQETTRNQLTADLVRQLSKMMSFRWDILAYDQIGVNDNPENPRNEFRYLATNFGISWRISRPLSFAATYTYRWNNLTFRSPAGTNPPSFNTTETKADLHQIGFSFTYKWE